jgi:hypothetical protein
MVLADKTANLDTSSMKQSDEIVIPRDDSYGLGIWRKGNSVVGKDMNGKCLGVFQRGQQRPILYRPYLDGSEIVNTRHFLAIG